jgi:anaerobic selenocysteine-containing dehydrogenase
MRQGGRTEAACRVATYCPLCVSRCGAVATVADGALHALEPDPSHPTGKALCMKGKAAPELVHHPERLRTPLRRTRPKGDPDPGWQPIGWDEALDITAANLSRIARAHGPESVVFSVASPSTSALSDSIDWVQRLQRAFGSPNFCVSFELCAWGRYGASTFTYGAPVPGAYLPDLDNAGCILLWGYNPSVARLCHATATVEAVQRGARLVVVDPRRAGLAHRADEWLQVRPGSDTVLALAMTAVMIDRGWFDASFVGRWTNGPLLVRSDDGRLLRERDLTPTGRDDRYVGWDQCGNAPVVYDPGSGTYERDGVSLALFGELEVRTAQRAVRCRPALQHVADACGRWDPQTAEAACGVPAAQIERTAQLLWEARPVAYYAWSGIEQHRDTTQIARAIAQIHALTGSFDVPGGNVLFPSVPTHPIAGAELLSDEQRAKALGLPRRPLGPSRWELVTSDDVYTAALEGRPYRARGLVTIGANLLLAHADAQRGRQALAALDFQVHTDLFMSPTAQMADIVLPVTSAFEAEALAVGFEVSPEARSLVQLRKRLVAPRGAARSDMRIVFDLATRLGLGAHFWDGDIDAAWRHQLAPSGVSLEDLRANPRGVRVPLETRHRKFAEVHDGTARGFDTPTRKVELYSEILKDGGYPPVPEAKAPELAHEDGPYPLVLTCAKSTWFCESQHRNLPSLRRRAPDPHVELHPDAARERGIGEGDWVRIETPHGSVRARAKLNPTLAPDVVCGQHGWWQGCTELGASAHDPFSPEGANFNLLLRHEPSDPIGGSVPHRSAVCNVKRAYDIHDAWLPQVR